MQAKFSLGQLVATPNALKMVNDNEILFALNRHVQGDWGDLCEDDKKENDFSVDNDLRILSAYHTGNGTKFWIITEANRSITTVLLPEDY